MIEKISFFLDLMRNLKEEIEILEDNLNLSFKFIDISIINILKNEQLFDDNTLFENVNGFFEMNLIDIHSGIKFEYDFEQNDVILLSDTHILCEEDEYLYMQLLNKQEEYIPPMTRYNFLQSVCKCSNCKLNLKLIIRFKKKDFLTDWLQQEKIGKPLGFTNIFLWSTKDNFSEHFDIFDFMLKEPQPHLYVVLEEFEDINGGFNHFVFMKPFETLQDRIKSSCSVLLKKSEELENIINKQKKTTKKISGIKYFPPQYWLDENTLDLGHFNISKNLLMQTDMGFLISLWQIISDSTSSFQNQIRFELDREIETELTIIKTESNWYVNNDINKTIEINESSLIEFYEKCINQKYNESNYKLLRNAIILAGEEDLLSLITVPKRLIKYYIYQYEGLMNDKLKEQSEVVKSLVNATQVLKGRIIQNIDEVHKNLGNVVTILLGLIITYITLYAKNTSNSQEFIISIFVLFSLIYVPISLYRIINQTELSNKTFKGFYEDMDIIRKIYDYNFQEIIKVKEGNQQVEKKFKQSVWLVITILFMIEIILVIIVLHLINFRYSQTVFESYLSTDTFRGVYIIAIILWLITLGFYYNSQIRKISEHKDI